MSHYLNPSSLHVPDAQRYRISTSSTSVSSVSSFTSTRFDQHSTASQFTLSTPPLDSIFGNDPELQPFHHFSDPVAWQGLTDDQWKLHTLISKAESAIKEAEKGTSEDFDEAFLHEDIWHNDDLYNHTDEQFDAVAAVRARLMRGEQSATTRRALEIIEKRSRLVSASTVNKNTEPSSTSEVAVSDLIDDYAEDFELGDAEMLEIPPTPNNSGIEDSRDFSLETIDEVDEEWDDGLLKCTEELVCPPTPVISPSDADWNCPSFSTSNTSFSTAVSLSQLLMSPLILDNLATSSPAIVHNSFGNVDPISRSPIVSVSSFLFSSRRPLPISLLDESLDIAMVMRLEIEASLHNLSHQDDTPRANPDSAVRGQQLGLGLMNDLMPEAHGMRTSTQTGQASTSSEPPQVTFQENQDCSPDDTERATLGSIPGPQFEPARSSWEVVLEGLGGLTGSTTDSDLPSQDEGEVRTSSHLAPFRTSGSLCKGVRPYISKAPPVTMAYARLGSNIDGIMTATVTAGSNHPAASAAYLNPAIILRESNQVRPKKKGLGMRLPSGLQRPLQRHSACLPRSKGCHDVAGLASSERMTSERLRNLRRRKLSPIAEVVSPELSPHPPSTNQKRFALLSSSNASPKRALVRSPAIRTKGPGRFLKRTLSFLF